MPVGSAIRRSAPSVVARSLYALHGANNAGTSSSSVPSVQQGSAFGPSHEYGSWETPHPNGGYADGQYATAGEPGSGNVGGGGWSGGGFAGSSSSNASGDGWDRADFGRGFGGGHDQQQSSYYSLSAPGKHGDRHAVKQAESKAQRRQRKGHQHGLAECDVLDGEADSVGLDAVPAGHFVSKQLHHDWQFQGPYPLLPPPSSTQPPSVAFPPAPSSQLTPHRWMPSHHFTTAHPPAAPPYTLMTCVPAANAVHMVVAPPVFSVFGTSTAPHQLPTPSSGIPPRHVNALVPSLVRRLSSVSIGPSEAVTQSGNQRAGRNGQSSSLPSSSLPSCSSASIGRSDSGSSFSSSVTASSTLASTPGRDSWTTENARRKEPACKQWLYPDSIESRILVPSNYHHNLAEFEEKLGVRFSSRELLLRALVHESYYNICMPKELVPVTANTATQAPGRSQEGFVNRLGEELHEHESPEQLKSSPALSTQERPEGRDVLELLTDLREARLNEQYHNTPGTDAHVEHSAIRGQLEQMGDAVLNLVAADYFSRATPRLKVGDLTIMKSHLRSNRTLALVGHSVMDLSDVILASARRPKFGKVEVTTLAKSGIQGRALENILADTVEAIVGAIYFDHGILAACDFCKTKLLGWLEEALLEDGVGDPMTTLNTLVTKTSRTMPVFRRLGDGEVVDIGRGASGAPGRGGRSDYRDAFGSNTWFTVELTLAGVPASIGRGTSIADAKREAAKAALGRWDKDLRQLVLKAGKAGNLKGNARDADQENEIEASMSIAALG